MPKYIFPFPSPPLAFPVSLRSVRQKPVSADAFDGAVGIKLMSTASRAALGRKHKRDGVSAAAAEEPEASAAGGVKAISREALSARLGRARVPAAGAGAAASGDLGGGRRKLQAACADGSGVFVTSSEFPELEGCLAEVDVYINTNEIEFLSDTGLIVASATVDTPDTVS